MHSLFCRRILAAVNAHSAESEKATQNYTYFELRWAEQQEQRTCFQVLSDLRADHDAGFSTLQNNRMIVTVSNSSAVTPSSAAVSCGNSPDDNLNSGLLISVTAISAILLVLVVVLLIYRKLRRKSVEVWVSKLGSSGSPYQTMRDEDGRAAHSFTMEFNNPKADSSNSFETAVIADNDADGKVTVLGYRPLREDGDDNCKANAEANIPLPPTALVQPFRPASTDLRAESHSSCEVSEHFSSESSPPDTYIGDPLNSFEMKSSEVTVPDREPSVIEESGRENSENVVLPGYVVRRRGSILKNPNTKSKATKVVHFPVSILALRTVLKYEKMESYEEHSSSVQKQGDDCEDVEVTRLPSRDYAIAKKESVEDMSNFPVGKNFVRLNNAGSIEENDNSETNGVPLSDPSIEKIRMAVYGKKVEEGDQE